MKTKTIIVLIISLSLYLQGISQTYKVASYELCNLNTTGEETNCKKFLGASLFEHFKIDPQFSIAFKYVGKNETYKTKWDDKSIIDNKNGTYTYKMIDEYNSDTLTYFIVLLIFNNDHKLIKGFYSLVKDGAPITCKLALSDQ